MKLYIKPTVLIHHIVLQQKVLQFGGSIEASDDYSKKMDGSEADIHENFGWEDDNDGWGDPAWGKK